MKKLLIIIACLLHLVFQAYAQKPADLNASESTVRLFNKLNLTVKKGIMIGHQDDIVYGHSWKSQGISDVKQTIDDFPAVFGWELGDLELAKTHSLDSVAFDDIRKGIQWVHSQDGINTISWHCNNPLTGGNAWDVTSKLVVKSVLPGGGKNEEFIKMLDLLADFFLSLSDKNGKLVPVIFRPYHEHTGSWFWWGQNLCSTQEYIDLWKYTVKHMVNRNVHNILYAYSSSGGFKNSQEYLERYPGDDIVDLLGFDEYQGGVAGKARYIKSVKKGMDIIIPIAKDRKKIAILAETGLESIPDKKWFSETLWPSIKDYPISYVLMWRNAHDKPKHYYMPFPGQESAEDFKKWEKYPKTLFLKDIQKY